jgi:hypothetical protein
MNIHTVLYQKKEAFIKSYSLILIAFATAFFPRIINSVGFPAIINFVHFAIVPFFCCIVIFTSKTKYKKQIFISKSIISSIFILLGVIAASALLNQAGVINVFLSLMLLSEPSVLLLAIICIPMTEESFKIFKTWIVRFNIFNIFLALSQHFLISAGILGVTSLQPADNVQGVFYLSGSGHVVSASVSMSFALYYFSSAEKSYLWMRASIFFAAFMQLLFADAKQVLLVWLAGWLLLILINIKDLRATLQYIIGAILVGFGFWWCINNVELFASFKGWIRPELYGSDGVATLLKIAPFRIIPSYYHSPLNWLLGLGPGHTIGRLGGWMLKDYGFLLKPLGATIHPASEAVWQTYIGNWLNSTFFSPLWGWAGIWGDFGFLGLAAYLYIILIIWLQICIDDFSKFTILTMMIFGLIVTQMEEPGYMLSMTSFIGLRWHEHKIAKRSRLASILSPDAEHQPRKQIPQSYIKPNKR